MHLLDGSIGTSISCSRVDIGECNWKGDRTRVNGMMGEGCKAVSMSMPMTSMSTPACTPPPTGSECHLMLIRVPHPIRRQVDTSETRPPAHGVTAPERRAAWPSG